MNLAEGLERALHSGREAVKAALRKGRELNRCLALSDEKSRLVNQRQVANSEMPRAFLFHIARLWFSGVSDSRPAHEEAAPTGFFYMNCG